MCSVGSNVRVLPVQSSAGPVGEIRIERTPETQALFPKRLPAVRVKGGAIVIGRERTQLNGTIGE